MTQQLAERGLVLSVDEVTDRCEKLEGWGNLVRGVRDARVPTVRDFLGSRSRFQASRLGGRVHRGDRPRTGHRGRGTDRRPTRGSESGEQGARRSRIRAGRRAMGNRVAGRIALLASRTPGAVADAVPVESAFELAELAGAVCGDAHALDDGQVTAAVVLRALAAATGTPSPTTAAARRDLWSAVGVSPDAVSGTLLTWAVRPPGDDPWSVMMRARADLGLVTHVTAQEWRAAADRPWAVGGQDVFACENPQVLQAAAWAGTSTPLLCTSGNPATVALRALDRLTSDGVTVSYHGDFDVAGIRMAKRLFDRGVRPWRYSAGDYLDAVVSARLPLGDPVPDTPWSPGLAEAMREHRVAVHEEAVLALLLDDSNR